MSTPTEPGIYALSNPDTFGAHVFEVEVYRSQKGFLRARILEAVKLRGKFQGKRVETFSKRNVWKKLN